MHDRPSEPWLVPIVGTMVAVLGQALVLTRPHLAIPHFEETINIGQSAAMGWTPWSQWFDLQHRPFCGGCTVVGVWARPWLALSGGTIWGWKLSLAVFSAIGVLGVARTLQRERGPTSSALFCLLWALAPPLFATAAFRGWGNHFEAAMVAVAAICLARLGRPLVAGVLAGAAWWMARSSVVLAALAMWTTWHRNPDRRGRALGGLIVGLSPIALHAALSTQGPFAELGYLANTSGDPQASWWTVARMADIFAPDLRSPFGPDFSTLELLLATAILATILASLPIAWRGGEHHLPVVIVLWLVALSIAPVEPRGAGRHDLEDSRYLLPALVLLPWLLVSAWDHLRTVRPRLALALCVPFLLAGTLDRVNLLWSGSPSLLSAPALDEVVWWENAKGTCTANCVDDLCRRSVSFQRGLGTCAVEPMASRAEALGRAHRGNGDVATTAFVDARRELDLTTPVGAWAAAHRERSVVGRRHDNHAWWCGRGQMWAALRPGTTDPLLRSEPNEAWHLGARQPCAIPSRSCLERCLQ